MIKILATIIAIFFTTTATAMEFGRLGGTFTMVGPIESDDYISFIISLDSWDNPPTVFHITSNGGDLEQAMLIGNLIRESQIPVWTGDECLSACVFIYAAGVERYAKGKVGLHRPYFNKKYFANLTSSQAKDKYIELRKNSENYLEKMEVSRSIIERMFQTGSTDIDLLSPEEANQMFGFSSPFYEEWIIAQCGVYTEEQAKVISSLASLQALRATIAISRDESLPKADNFGANVKELMQESLLALKLEKAGLLQPYVELSEIRERCQEKSVNKHVYAFHASLKEFLNDLAAKSFPEN